MKQLLWMILVLSGCQWGGVQSPEVNDAAPVVEPPVQRKAVAVSRDQMIDRLLSQGEIALQAGRLTEPEESNAADRFRAVLLLEPDNARAREGMRMINLSYAEVIREALAKGRLQQARRALRSMQAHFPGSPINRVVVEEVKRAEASVRPARPKATLQEGEEWVELSAVEVGRRSEEVQSILAEVATRLSQTDRSVMIYARSDAEGRWIYKAMNDAVDGFRIRGDIRVADQPALKLMAPL